MALVHRQASCATRSSLRPTRLSVLLGTLFFAYELVFDKEDDKARLSRSHRRLSGSTGVSHSHRP